MPGGSRERGGGDDGRPCDDDEQCDRKCRRTAGGIPGLRADDPRHADEPGHAPDGEPAWFCEFDADGERAVGERGVDRSVSAGRQQRRAGGHNLNDGKCAGGGAGGGDGGRYLGGVWGADDLRGVGGHWQRRAV